jgi:predicted NBD/HSP70 family sugar kinase
MPFGTDYEACEVDLMGYDPEAKILVFDIGGTHASAAVASAGDLHGASSVSLDNDATAEEILRALEQLGKDVLAEFTVNPQSVSGLSLGFPNPFDYERGISYMRHKYGRLYGCNLRSELSARFRVPADAVAFVNDASAYLLGEVHYGTAVGVDRVVGITLGTGVGSAFSVGGRIVTRGENVPNDGFVWDIPYQGSIVEEFISARGIRKLYKDLSGEELDVREIARKSATDQIAMNTMRQFGETLGAALKTVCGDFRPEAIVLGGAISHSAHLFLPTAQEQLKETGARLVVSRLFEDAALLGAFVAWRLTKSAAANAEPAMDSLSATSPTDEAQL